MWDNGISYCIDMTYAAIDMDTDSLAWKLLICIAHVSSCRACCLKFAGGTHMRLVKENTDVKRIITALSAAAAALLTCSQARALLVTIEDFSGVAANGTAYTGSLTGVSYLPGWEIGGLSVKFLNDNGDMMMYCAGYGKYDIGIKLTKSGSEYVPAWDATQASEAISLANATNLQFTFVNKTASTITTQYINGRDYRLYVYMYYHTGAGVDQIATLVVDSSTWLVNVPKTLTIPVDTITGFNKATDVVFGFRVDTPYSGPQLDWTSAKCDITNTDGLPAPDAVINLSVVNDATFLPRSLVLSWSAPADQSGWWDKPVSYDIRYSTTPFPTAGDATAQQAWWDAATQLPGEPTPKAVGTTQTLPVTGLTGTTDYYFVMTSKDSFGDVSACSNVCLAHTPDPDLTPPDPVMDLAGTVYHANNVVLTFTATGDDHRIGTATTYDLRYATFPITDSNFSSATPVTGLPSPKVAGSAETFTVSNLTPGNTYYFALNVADEWPNWSGLTVTSVDVPPDTMGPYAVSDLAVTSPASRSITLTWTAPADQGIAGVAGYDVRYSTSSIDDSNWNAATQAAGEPTPVSPGTSQTFVVAGLDPSTTYYFAVKSFDWSSPANVSAISNIASGMTRPVMLPVTVHNPWLVNDRVANTHDINTMGATYSNAYTPDGVVPPTTEEEKAINVYNNQKRRLYHWAVEPPTYNGTNRDPVYNQNVFGWGLCGSHAMQGLTIAKYAGFQHTRFRTVNSGKADAHNIYEVQYADGTWHLLDDMTTMYVYTRTTPRHIASLAEIAAAGTLVQTAVAEGRSCPGLLLCGDSPSWYDTSAATASGSDETLAPTTWSPNMDLRVGQSFKRTWESWLNEHPTSTKDADSITGNDPPYHHEANKDYKDTVNLPYWEPYALNSTQDAALNIGHSVTYRRWANGTDTLAPDFRGPAYTEMLDSTSHDIATYNTDSITPDLHGSTVGTQGEAVFKVNIPFYITDASFSGDFVRTNTGDVCNVLVSKDGVTWVSSGLTVPVGTTHVSNQPLASTNIFKKMSTWYIKIQVKATNAKSNAGVSNLVVTTIYEHNKGAMAYLDKGVNHITLTFDNPAELVASSNVLHVAYKWKEYDGTDWTIDRQADRYINSSPANFTITTGGSKVPRTEYILMEIVQPPSADMIAPAAVTDLTAPADKIMPKAVELTWTAPADDGTTLSSGRADSYDLRYSTSLITADNFYSATPVSPGPIPGTPGTIEHFTVGRLAPTTTYYFALKTSDEAPNTSLISNVVSVTTPVYVPDINPPLPVADLAAATTTTLGQFVLTWTAPTDLEDGYVTAYDLRWSTNPITADNFSSATTITGLTTPKNPTSAESFTASNLPTGKMVYFAVKSVDGSGNWSDVSNQASAKKMMGTITFQNGQTVNGLTYAGCVDAYIDKGNQSTEYSTQTYVKVSGGAAAANIQRTLVKFDMSSIPTAATVTKATLYLYAYSSELHDARGGKYGAYHIYTAWPGGTHGLTWNMPWVVSGGSDCDGTPDAQTAKQTTTGVWYAFDVTSRVQQFVSGANANYGWCIHCLEEGYTNTDWFYASEYTGDATLRPKLVITDMVGEDAVAPAPITNLADGSATTTTVDLTWTATGDDGAVGTATRYDLRYSTTQITNMASFNLATPVTVPAPKPAGAAEAFTLSGLSPGTTYYFAVVVYDEAGNASGLSNVINVTTPTPPKPGDINHDTYVNIGDLQLLVAAWASAAGDSNWNADADLNSDGQVNVIDLQVLVAHWGQ